MKLYSSNDDYKLYEGSMLDMLDEIQSNSIDSIITDPPYELNFMNKGWDNSGIAFKKETWEKCYQVLKPGGYLLAFGGSRTFHRIACAIEDAGFEIRDTIMWLYGSGFPKSMNLGLAIDKKNGVESKVVGYMDAPDLQDIGHKQKELGNGHIQSFGQIENAERLQYEIKEALNEWNDWGTCLKPSFEPIIVARKPFDKSLVENVLENRTGGLNIGECRVKTNGEAIDNHNTKGIPFMRNKEDYQENSRTKLTIGRFPANTIFTYDDNDFKDVLCGFRTIEDMYTARYFYCAKASKKDRDEGLDNFESKKVNDGRLKEIDNPFQRGESPKKNIHPTVKPTELMQYLIRLVTARGGTVLDCFNGSGSTGKGVMYENKERNANYKYIGIELTSEYLPIAKARIEYAYNYKYDDPQLSIFDLEDIEEGNNIEKTN